MPEIPSQTSVIAQAGFSTHGSGTSQELADKSRVYDGPVGAITFNKGSGLMNVRIDRTLTKGSEAMSKNK